jgi:hypothetical protein
MKLTRKRLKEIIKEELLNEIQIEVEDIQDMEAAIFDIIIEFKKNFEKSEFKKSGHARKINSIIKQMLKLEAQLGNIVGDF